MGGIKGTDISAISTPPAGFSQRKTNTQTNTQEKKKKGKTSAAPTAADERPRSRRMFARRIWFGAFCEDNTGRETRRLCALAPGRRRWREKTRDDDNSLLSSSSQQSDRQRAALSASVTFRCTSAAAVPTLVSLYCYAVSSFHFTL